VASSGDALSTLSGGNQQKVVIGKAMNTRPHVLLLDEPTRGVDVEAKRQIYLLIRELAKDGLAVVVVSSETEELLEVCDRIVVMRNGKTYESIPREGLKQDYLFGLMMRKSDDD
jgi:simple sugar transport system ATP-binding protein